MRTLIACVLIASLAPLCRAAASEAETKEAEQQITARAKDYADAWAKHEGKAVADFYTDDGEIITVAGLTFTGRQGIEQGLGDAFNDVIKDTALVERIEKVRLIKPDVALVDSEVQIKPMGGGDTDGEKFHVVSLVVKKDGKWLTETTRCVKYRDE
jgi:uncharacterized protein (TIGR02246 family)